MQGVRADTEGLTRNVLPVGTGGVQALSKRELGGVAGVTLLR